MLKRETSKFKLKKVERMNDEANEYCYDVHLPEPTWKRSDDRRGTWRNSRGLAFFLGYHR